MRACLNKTLPVLALLTLTLFPATALAQGGIPRTAPVVAAADSDSAVSTTRVTDTAVAKRDDGFFGRIRNSALGQLYLKGGIVMHPLLLCAILGLVLIIERMWTLSRARTNTRKLMVEVTEALRTEGPDAALQLCQRSRGPIAAIMHAGLLRVGRGPEAVEKAIASAGAIEMAHLERGLLALASVSNVAPLLGFLGTVTGMIAAFAAIAAAEQVSAKLVAKGIEEALITTAAGLMIAVPVSAFYSYFVLQIDRFVLEMEEASADLVDELIDLERSGGRPPLSRS
ncbi:MAG TPA: MotA/TolQ/ExbB proton channel family protein [Candidatus Krumholzibacteria bacterium]|nr:MotA/TolQ/ExbB proton channel family protein [Candidatus Krumholzibacteria bacterium]